MTELTVVRGPSRGTSITLTADRSATIGTATEADLRVGGEQIAAEHVVVKALKGGGFGAKGLAGPFVLNGQPTAAARLAHGDVLTVGDSEIRYAERSAAESPAEIGGFRLLGVLGKGGWGTVWRAEQKSLGREVALKVLSEERTADPVFVGRFQAEARNAARLHHPNVVQVFDVDHDGATWFYSMELMHGGSLETRLKRDGTIPVDAAIGFIRDAARGLAFAEQMRIVHRDIKPDNLMVDRHGHVKIADLGLAMTDDDGDGKLVGTPHFMSPEQVQKQPLDHRSDLYSLGCTFYRLVTGATPFSGDGVKQILRAQLEETAKPAHEVNSAVPAAVGQVIERLMAKSPDARYQSATDLIADLEQLAAPPARRGIWIAVAVGVAVIATAVAVIVSLNQPPPQEPTRVVEYIDDPEARKALEAKARLEAENALLQVRARRLAGLELAEALEKVAEAHPGTPSAETATKEAAATRAEIARRAAAEEQLAAEIDATATAMRTAFDAALAKDDLPAAAAVLAGNPATTNPDVAQATKLTETRTALTTTLQERVTTQLAALRSAIDDAITAKDPAAVRTAAEALAKVAAPDGWPDAILADRAGVAKLATDAFARADALVAELAHSAQRDAWAGLRDRVCAPDGVLSQVARFDPAGAAVQLAQLAADTPGSDAAARATLLAPALEAAGRYLTALDAAAQTGDLTIVDPRNGDATTIAGFDRTAGLRIRSGPRGRTKDEVIPLAEVRIAAASWLPPVGDVADHSACIAVLAIANHVEGARSYLGRLATDDDASGTGDNAYGVALGGLDNARAILAASSAPWAAPLADELRAVQLVAGGLSALSSRRNLTAAGMIEKALADHAQTLVVHCLL